MSANNSLTWYQKAQQLVNQRKAANFSEACSMVARRKRKPVASTDAQPVKQRLPYADN